MNRLVDTWALLCDFFDYEQWVDRSYSAPVSRKTAFTRLFDSVCKRLCKKKERKKKEILSELRAGIQRPYRKRFPDAYCSRRARGNIARRFPLVSATSSSTLLRHALEKERSLK